MEGSRPGAVVVMLIPARTDTIAFHEYIYNKAEIRLIKGRLRFRVNGKAGDAAPFPSMLAIFRGKEEKVLKIKITKEIPVEKRLRPAVGGVYDVLRKEIRSAGKLYFVEVGGHEVGVFWHECEIISEAKE